MAVVLSVLSHLQEPRKYDSYRGRQTIPTTMPRKKKQPVCTTGRRVARLVGREFDEKVR
jgi:hypothetical protein